MKNLKNPLPLMSELRDVFIRRVTLAAVFTDICAIKITVDDSFKTCMQKFYVVMRKYGIKQGTWAENGIGRTCDNPEWSFCLVAFEHHVRASLILPSLLQSPAKDLLAYGKRPMQKRTGKSMPIKARKRTRTNQPKT